ncbi:MAG: hypothetical protein AAB393_05430, partial [Bacteroidota bacterium]
MNHLDEETIELYVLESEEVQDRRAEIEAHLKECAGCMSLSKEIEEYYSEVLAIHEERSKAISQALTVRSIAVKVPTYTEFGPLSQIPKTWPARMVLFVIRHPYVATSGFVGFIVGAIIAAQMLLLPALKDRNPSYARAKDEFLVAYNNEGDVLWKKHIGPGYDWERLLADSAAARKPEQYLATVDVDGDGRREVIAIFYGDLGELLKNVVVCYNADGSQRWTHTVSRKIT